MDLHGTYDDMTQMPDASDPELTRNIKELQSSGAGSGSGQMSDSLDPELKRNIKEPYNTKRILIVRLGYFNRSSGLF